MSDYQPHVRLRHSHAYIHLDDTDGSYVVELVGQAIGRDGRPIRGESHAEHVPVSDPRWSLITAVLRPAHAAHYARLGLHPPSVEHSAIQLHPQPSAALPVPPTVQQAAADLPPVDRAAVQQAAQDAVRPADRQEGD